MADINQIEKYIGLCRAAGGVTTGTDLVLGEVRRGRAKFVLVASDASERTKKQIADKCAYYGVPHFEAGCDSDHLSHAVGSHSKSTAAAFSTRGPWRQVLDYYKSADAPQNDDGDAPDSMNGRNGRTDRQERQKG